jgi:hypothetical protein
MVGGVHDCRSVDREAKARLDAGHADRPTESLTDFGRRDTLTSSLSLRSTISTADLFQRRLLMKASPAAAAACPSGSSGTRLPNATQCHTPTRKA